MKLTLHVGLPKTGTTTIQHVLDRIKPQLAERGVLYPGTTVAQLDLVRRSQRDRSGMSTAEGSLGEAVERMAHEIRAVRPRHVVLSCEHMVLVPAREVARLKDVIAHRLPEIREVAVLCYVREPIGFATSLCQQRLKSGTMRLAEFCAAPWPYNIRDLIAKHVDCYGRSAVRLRSCSPQQLVGASIVGDFLSQIGVPDLPLPMPVPRLNPSLSHPAVLVADALVALRPRGDGKRRRNAQFKRLLEAIPGPKFVLAEEVQQRIIEASSRDLEAIRARFGLNIVPERVEQSGDLEWPAEMVRAKAEDILRQVEGAGSDTRQ